MAYSPQGSQLIFFVNGHKVAEREPDPEVTLLQYLRDTLQLFGTKRGCDMGACGSCTVMLSTYNHKDKKISHKAVMACLIPICSLHGVAVTTIEGIGSTREGLHPVQNRLANSHGTQCGFCSPGMVMSMYTLLHNNPHPNQHDIEVALEGNLCRCTGYRPILDAFKHFTKDFQCPLGDKCCKQQKQSQESSEIPASKQRFLPQHTSQDPIFPSELQLNSEYNSASLVFHGPHVAWYQPTTLTELLELRTQHPEAKLVAGSTSLGIQAKHSTLFPAFISINHIHDLQEVKVTEEGVILGAAVTFTKLEQVIRHIINDKPETKTEALASFLDDLRWFTCSQLRNVATLGGNIMSEHPGSFVPLLIAIGAELTIISHGENPRQITLDDSFYDDFNNTILNPEDVILSIFIPFIKKDEYFCTFHHSARRAFSYPIVNAAMKVSFEENSAIIKTIQICFGGIKKRVITPSKVTQSLIGRKWSKGLIEEGSQILTEDLHLNEKDSNDLFTLNLAEGFFLRFVLIVGEKLNNKYPQYKTDLSDLSLGLTKPLVRGLSHGNQVYEQVSPGQPLQDAVGRPLPHASAKEHVTGEAQYVDDIPVYKGELHAVPVLSTKAHAKILNIDASEALSLPGVVDFITYKDVPGSNSLGVILQDEEIFATDKVQCQGQLIGVIIADSAIKGRRAASIVKVSYEELDPILTIDEAIESKSFFTNIIEPYIIGDADSKLASSAHVIEGEARYDSQEHMYLEPHASLIVPKVEHGEMEIYAATHDQASCQSHIGSALGIPGNKIYMRTKRLGGSFGGKETRSVIGVVPAAVAAYKLQKPVRYVLDRSEDMKMKGGRHPFLAKYKVGVNEEGKLQALYLTLYCDAGWAADNSPLVPELLLLNFLNTYMVRDVNIATYVCKTNLPSNTSFRGIGAIQGNYFANVIMTEITEHLGLSTEKVMEINLPRAGDLSAINQVHTKHMMRCWHEVLETSGYHKRQEKIKTFNKENKWKKKGLAVMPLVFGMGIYIPFLNRGAALVHIYKDGSVLVSHGGVEMGQGLHTKMIQVTSRALNVPVDIIHIAETNSSAVPNAASTGGSDGSDANGMAIIQACEILKDRLKPYIEAAPGAGWKSWVVAAYMDRVSLSSTGFWKKPGLNYDRKTNKGVMQDYFTYGAGVSEVEIDCLTGEHVLHRTDIVMDVGTSLNPAIDVGQIEGGFMQGYGGYTMEERRFSDSGAMLHTNPGSYKIPTFNDIPIEFNVSLLKESKNPKAVYSSKGIGEPPLLLGLSAFLAIREAIKASRLDAGLEGKFLLESPATSRKIQALCGHVLTKENLRQLIKDK